MGRTGVLSVIGLTTCVAVVGCATPNAVAYSTLNSPPRPFVRRAPGSVDVFVGRPPTRPYVDVGLFEVYQGHESDGSGQSTEEMLGTLRLHAALRGCDALQIMGVELAGHYLLRVVRGVCEIYTDPQAQQASKGPPPERLPGEGQLCGLTPGPTGAPTDCLNPLVCSKSVCVSPYQ